jgi:hypothetical protein
MGRYGQSLDLGKELENEAAREAQAKAAQEAEKKAEETAPETPVEEPREPVGIVTSVSEEPKPMGAAPQTEKEFPEEPDLPEEPPRPPDPGEEDVVEILSKHVPHVAAPKKRAYGWILVLLGIALLAGFFWSQYSHDTLQGTAAMAPLQTPQVSVPEVTPQNVSTEDELSRLLAAGLQDARVRSISSV